MTKHFSYIDSEYNEYYEKLDSLIDSWESETVEFKAARNKFDFDKVGKYFSAISNESNLRKHQYGWFIMGVDESKSKTIVGTTFKEGNPDLLEKYKYEISQFTNDNMTFLDIIELFPIVDGKKYRVLLFKIPAATTGMPTSLKNNFYSRSGDSLIPLAHF